MRIRDAVLENNHAFSTKAHTWTFPIDVRDPITELKVLFSISTWPAAGAAEDFFYPYPMPYMIKEIAVIDGSEVIFALPGPLIFSMSCYDLGYSPYHTHQEMFTRRARFAFPIHFGRSLLDPNWIFDPSKFRNPQLRITWDSEWRAINQAGLYKVDATTDYSIFIDVWAKIMEEGADPVGYLMTKMVKEYTPAGAGDEITWLPCDFPHRKLLVRSYLHGGRQTTGIGHLKLSQDQDKWIPFDHDGDNFIQLMKNWFTEVQLHGYHFVEDGAYRQHMCGDLSSGLVVSSGGSYFVSPTNWVGNTFQSEIRDFNGAQPDNTHRVELWSQGMTRTPFDCYCYPFGDQSDPADWLEVAPMGNLRLILTHATETWENFTGFHLTQIASQQAHPY